MVCKAVVAPQQERLLDSFQLPMCSERLEASLRAKTRTALRESGPCGEALRYLRYGFRWVPDDAPTDGSQHGLASNSDDCRLQYTLVLCASRLPCSKHAAALLQLSTALQLVR
jgi:hypothetical protein